jgi:tetratricopeptide (TPR) repeat protein
MRERSRWILVGLALLSPLVRRPPPLAAQRPDSAAFYKALDLETSGKYKDAVPLFRAALHSSAGTSALLGLERVYAELGWADSLLAPLDTLIAANPREPIFRTVQLRTLQSMQRETELRRAFERWVNDAPNDPTPYREYARILLQRNQATTADSVIGRARQTLGTTKDLMLEVAQLRAAQGQWLESANAWRGALSSASYLEQAAAYALAPTPGALRQQFATSSSLHRWRFPLVGRSRHWRRRGVLPRTDGMRSRICLLTARARKRGRTLGRARKPRSAGRWRARHSRQHCDGSELRRSPCVRQRHRSTPVIQRRRSGSRR